MVKKNKVSVADKKKKLYNRIMDEKRITTDQTTIRINKYLSAAGVCSRREADQLTDAGRVTVAGKEIGTGERIPADAEVFLDGRPVKAETRQVLLLFYKPRVVVTELGTKVKRSDEIKFHDQPVNIERKVYVLLNKPKDCVTTSDDPQERKTVMDFVKGACKERIYPVGRLDKDSEGLLLLTNQGDLVNRIMRAGNYHEKEYEVTVDKKITETFIRKMSSGVPILGTVTRPCTVYKTGDKSFSIILTQGLNRQIRRMCEYLGYHVCTLKRIRIMNLTLDGLKCGEYREICGDEWKKLNELIRDSSSETVIRTGGQHGNISGRTNKRTGAEAERSGKGILSGRPGDHEQQRVRRTVRSTGKNGKGNRNRSGRQPNC